MDEKKVREAIAFLKTSIFLEKKAFKNETDELLIDVYRSVVLNYETAIEALEKQLPKKVEVKEWSPAKCPSCGIELSESIGDGFYRHPTFLGRCPNEDCGQLLDWSE